MSQLAAAKLQAIRDATERKAQTAVVGTNPLGQRMVMTPLQKWRMEELARRQKTMGRQVLTGAHPINPVELGTPITNFTLVGGVQDHSVDQRAARRAEKAAADETDALLAELTLNNLSQLGDARRKTKPTPSIVVAQEQRESIPAVTVEDETNDHSSNSDDELLDVIQAAAEHYEQADRIAAEDARVAQAPHVAAAAAAIERELGDMPADPSDPEHAIKAAELAFAAKNNSSAAPEAAPTAPKDDSISMRAKRMIMGEHDLGQYLFKHTDTMLPRKHQQQMGPLLKLFGRGIIVVDVFCGEQRAALGFLAPLSSQSRWVPGDDYIVQTAAEIQAGTDKGTVQCEVIARQDLAATDKWQLGKHREHRLNDYPRKHLARLARVTGTSDAFKLMWRTMCMVFIWEREPRDNLAALIAFVGQL
jgi:hypothetical protein